jgi:hypothetical protein
MPSCWHHLDGMIRTQIQFTVEQHRQLKRWAAALGVSVSEAVRRCVAERLAGERGEPTRADRVREARAVFGKYADPAGRSRVARDHDEELARAYRA